VCEYVSVWVSGCSGKRETNGKAALAILIYVGWQRFAKLLNAASGIRTGNQKAARNAGKILAKC